MAERSALRVVFDRVERFVGEPLETAVATEVFMDVAARAVGIMATARHLRDAASAGVLHRFNLPAYSDMVALTEEIRRLEARVRDLSQPVHQAPPKPRSAAPRRRA